MSAGKTLATAATLGVLVGGGLLAAKSIHMVDPGYVGVVYSLNGGIQGDVLQQGLHIISPFYKVTDYSIATEQGYLSSDSKESSEGDDSFSIPTSDGKTVNIDLEYSYHFDSELLPQTFTKFKGQDGKTIERTFMRGKLKTWVGEVSSQFSVIDIYGEKRAELNASVLQYVKEKFIEYGIVIDSVNVSRIGLDAQTEQAIQQKINKQQELETARLDKEKAEIAAAQKLVEEQAEADAKIIKAQAEAQAELIRAEAQAEANKKLAESLTDNLIKSQMIDKWDGEVSKITGTEGTSVILNGLE